jgi:hypothetical protein
MLAGVQDQEDSLVSQVCDESGRGVVRLKRQPQHRGYSRRNQVGIIQRAKIDEMHGASERIDHVMPGRRRNGGLADPTRADDRDKARGRQFRGKRGRVVGSPNHAG